MLHQLLLDVMPRSHTIVALLFPSMLCITLQITTCMDHVDRLGGCLRDLQVKACSSWSAGWGILQVDLLSLDSGSAGSAG